MGNITGGVTVSADGKCRDFAFGVLTSSGQRALLVFAYICLLFSTLSLCCVYLFFYTMWALPSSLWDSRRHSSSFHAFTRSSKMQWMWSRVWRWRRSKSGNCYVAAFLSCPNIQTKHIESTHNPLSAQLQTTGEDKVDHDVSPSNDRDGSLSSRAMSSTGLVS